MNAPATTLDAVLNARLDELRAADLYRTRRIVERRPTPVRGVHAVIDGRDCVAFCSNDYLGLAQHPEVIEAFVRAAREHGVGSGASPLVTGHHALHHALEEQLAAWTGRERALLFSTGYMANLAVATALTGPDDTVLEDRLNHASLLDGGRLSRARFERYPHADAAALESALATRGDGHALVLTDGVFSMDGDLAPLPALAAACRRHGAWLAVDDAHGIGVAGATGRGTTEHHGLTADDIPVLVGTLGKAFGTFGAFVAGSGALIEFLIQRARTHIYTTALPPAVAAATSAALAVAAREAWRRERVLTHAARFRDAAAALGLPLPASATPIQPVILGSARAALAASAALLQRGLLVTAIRPPTVPPGTSRLRVTFSAEHTDADVDRLIEALAALPRADAAA